MCLILVGWRSHAHYPLVVAANRDEFYARPTAFAARWPETPQVIGGRDLEAGGTWLGMSENGRFAAITNVREPGMPVGKKSRGELTRDFLLADFPAAAYAARIAGGDYAGFNLLLGDGVSLLYCSNRGTGPQVLAPGIYGLSNSTLDTPWPKLESSRRRFSGALRGLPDEEAFFELLADREMAADEDLPKTGVPLAWERLLSAVFVASETYGTRASTILLQRTDGVMTLHERSFGPMGRPLQSSVISTGV